MIRRDITYSDIINTDKLLCTLSRASCEGSLYHIFISATNELQLVLHCGVRLLSAIYSAIIHGPFVPIQKEAYQTNILGVLKGIPMWGASYLAT